MTIQEAEEIYMAWQSGANYPEELLPAAILLLSKQSDSVKNDSELA